MLWKHFVVFKVWKMALLVPDIRVWLILEQDRSLFSSCPSVLKELSVN